MTTKSKPQTMEQVFFQARPCLKSHVYWLRTHPDEYVRTLRFLCNSKTLTVVSPAVKARILSALHITGQHKSVSFFLAHCEVVDVVKALNLLDRPRQIRQLERRIDTIEMNNPHLVIDESEKEKETEDEKRSNSRFIKKRIATRATTSKNSSSPKEPGTEPKRQRNRRRAVDKYRNAKCTLESEEACTGTDSCTAAHADSATLELIRSASVSGAFARKVRLWTKSQRSDLLEFVLLALPLDAWKQLADLAHVRPADFTVPYFLKSLYGANDDDAAVEHNFVTCMSKLLTDKDRKEYQEHFFSIAQEFPQVYLNYSLIRLHSHLTSTKAIMEEFAARAPLDTVVWYFEEFHRVSKQCQNIVSERIQEHGEGSLSVNSKMTYGKLVERILTMRRMGVSFAEQLVPMAQARLEALRAFWNSDASAEQENDKVAVFGDASSSMQNAIEAATIFASMVSVCFDGELSFFASDLVPSPHTKPNNVHEALEVCTKVRASGCTSLASALWPYYEDKIVMDMFVMVTDEEENTRKNGYSFAKLLAAYKKEVNPKVSLLVVCVGHGDCDFRADLASNGIDYKLVQVDGSRPDHAKFDALLGQLALLCMKKECTSENTSVVTNDDSSELVEEFVVV